MTNSTKCLYCCEFFMRKPKKNVVWKYCSVDCYGKSLKGRPGKLLGRRLSETTYKKICAINKERARKMKLLGLHPWNYGHRTRRKIIEYECLQCKKYCKKFYRSDRSQRFCSSKCSSVYILKGKPGYNSGRKFSYKPRIDLRGKHPWNYGRKSPECSGSKSHLWRGGVTELNAQIRTSLEYKMWRRKVFERDDYTCRNCGQRGGDKHAHHIKPFATHKELIFDINNGLTLCKECHKLTDSYLKRNLLSDSLTPMVT